MAAALDTNVLVRLVVQDDADQADAAEALIRRSLAHHETLFVPVTVALELEWVLRSAFGFDKAAVVGAFARLLASYELEFESEQALETALTAYGDRTVDFADCLHAALAAQATRRPWWTFDRSASRLHGARLLTS